MKWNRTQLRKHSHRRHRNKYWIHSLEDALIMWPISSITHSFPLQGRQDWKGHQKVITWGSPVPRSLLGVRMESTAYPKTLFYSLHGTKNSLIRFFFIGVYLVYVFFVLTTQCSKSLFGNTFSNKPVSALGRMKWFENAYENWDSITLNSNSHRTAWAGVYFGSEKKAFAKQIRDANKFAMRIRFLNRTNYLVL